MVANASTVTAAFACKTSDYGGSGSGGGAGAGDRRRVVVAGKDLCSAATTLPIGVPCPGAWIFRRELISQALGDGGTSGSGGSGGSRGSVGVVEVVLALEREVGRWRGRLLVW